jgi:hypothetical protein
MRGRLPSYDVSVMVLLSAISISPRYATLPDVSLPRAAGGAALYSSPAFHRLGFFLSHCCQRKIPSSSLSPLEVFGRACRYPLVVATFAWPASTAPRLTLRHGRARGSHGHRRKSVAAWLRHLPALLAELARKPPKRPKPPFGFVD